MAHHKSAIKRIRTSAQRRDRNRHFRTTMRTEIKKFEKVLAEGDVEAVRAALPGVMSRLQRSASKGIVARATASRKIGRLAKAVEKVVAGA